MNKFPIIFSTVLLLLTISVPLSYAENNDDKELEEKAGEAGEAIANAGEKTGEVIVETGEKAGEVIVETGEKAGEVIVETGEKAGEVIVETGEKAGEVIVETGEKAGEVIVETGEKAGEVIVETGEKAGEVIVETGEKTAEKGTIIGEVVVEKSSEGLDEINEKGGGCLIATAAYGSELMPQIQLLREIRDNTLMSTSSGAVFLTGFNQLYYSFSPSIADFERENEIFQEVVRLLITPMISTLLIMNFVEEGSEIGVLGVGILIIGLNLAIYVGLPVIIGHKIKTYINGKNKPLINN